MEFIVDFQHRYKSGVYIIQSLIDNRCYIGSTNNFRQRYNDHKSELRQGKHINKYIQNFVNKYGIKSLSFSLLCICENEFLRYNEKILIDQIKPVFNLKKLVVPAEKGIITYDVEKEKKKAMKTIDSIINETKNKNKSHKVVGSYFGGVEYFEGS